MNSKIKEIYNEVQLKSDILKKFRETFDKHEKKETVNYGRPKLNLEGEELIKHNKEVRDKYNKKRRNLKLYERLKIGFDELKQKQQINLILYFIQNIKIK